MNAEVKPKDLFSLIRLPVATLIVIIYNVVALSILQYLGFKFLAFSVIGYFIFATLLLFRYSKRIQSWILKPDANPEHFLKLLSFPLWLWAFLPSLTLIVDLIGIFD